MLFLPVIMVPDEGKRLSRMNSAFVANHINVVGPLSTRIIRSGGASVMYILHCGHPWVNKSLLIQ